MSPTGNHYLNRRKEVSKWKLNHVKRVSLIGMLFAVKLHVEIAQWLMNLGFVDARL